MLNGEKKPPGRKFGRGCLVRGGGSTCFGQVVVGIAEAGSGYIVATQVGSELNGLNARNRDLGRL